MSGKPVTFVLYPSGEHGSVASEPGIAVALRLRVEGQAEALAMISTTTVFGTPIDVTLSELALACFYPADDRTRAALQPGLN